MGCTKKSVIFIIFKQSSLFIIDYMDSSQSNPETKHQSRDYKCPCGKTYLSNAAIFTHIKHKHGGKAPGPIQKPKLQSKPRGRPPLTTKNKNTANSNINENEKTNEIVNEQMGRKIYFDGFNQIFTHLTEIYCRETFNPDIWTNVQTFKLMEDYIQTRNSRQNFKYMGVCIGLGVSEFLKEMSQNLQKNPWRFEQVLILIILLLQYVIDQNNSPQIVQEAPVQLLIDYMNPFIKDHIPDYAQFLDIQSLWIMKQQNMTKIFLCFYNWMKWKEYTQYCITLIS